MVVALVIVGAVAIAHSVHTKRKEKKAALLKSQHGAVVELPSEVVTSDEEDDSPSHMGAKENLPVYGDLYPRHAAPAY